MDDDKMHWKTLGFVLLTLVFVGIILYVIVTTVIAPLLG
jgi:hypothetical protein